MNNWESSDVIFTQFVWHLHSAQQSTFVSFHGQAWGSRGRNQPNQLEGLHLARPAHSHYWHCRRTIPWCCRDTFRALQVEVPERRPEPSQFGHDQRFHHLKFTTSWPGPCTSWIFSIRDDPCITRPRSNLLTQQRFVSCANRLKYPSSPYHSHQSRSLSGCNRLHSHSYRAPIPQKFTFDGQRQLLAQPIWLRSSPHYQRNSWQVDQLPSGPCLAVTGEIFGSPMRCFLDWVPA